MHGAGGATGTPTQACRPRCRRGKRGLDRQPDEQEALSALADRIAELAAEQARRLVATAAGLLRHGEGHGRVGVLEAIERAAQVAAAQIGLAALAGVVDWAGTHTPARAGCPDAGHGARLVARRTKTVRTLLGSIQTTRGYYHCATCKQGFAPLDDRLGAAGTSLSPGLSRACALAGAEMPYDKSRQFIATVTGLDLASTLARTTRAQGVRARDLIAAEHAAPGPVPAAPHSDGPLEENVAQLLRPMLRNWLDTHMPRIVEKALREEIKASQKKS